MKVWKYIVITTGLIFILKLAGLPTGADPVFKILGITFDTTGNLLGFGFSSSAFFNNLFQSTGAALGSLTSLGAGGLLGAAIIAGLLTRGKPENLIMLTFSTTILILFLATGISIITYAISFGQGWISAIIAFLLLPFTVGFIVALAEFFRGTD